MTIYDDMRAVAIDVFNDPDFKQGVVEYVALEQQAGGTPDDPAPEIERAYRINSTVRPVSTQYVDSTHIVQSDRQVSMPNVGVTPSHDGFVRIDGSHYSIVEVMPRPSAGTPVVFILIVRR